jgi:hypothetical protein
MPDSRLVDRRQFLHTAGLVAIGALAGCSGSDGGSTDMDAGTDTPGMSTDTPAMGTDTDTSAMDTDSSMMRTNPAEAPTATVDRFSEAAGTLMVRGEANELPGPDDPIDFDQKPFRHTGLGPTGRSVTYYNFDVQPTAPAPIYVLVREGEEGPVEDQLNVVDVKPGESGYNDIWQVTRVTVPSDYTANTVTSLADIEAGDYDISPTQMLVNCPVVPAGSSASMRAGDADTGLVQGWYQGRTITYFAFEEANLTAQNGAVPTSPIYVTFNTNPGQEGGGAASGFVTEAGSAQNHNVVATLPGDDGYSPLWMVNVYDNADFDAVSDLASAQDATILARGAATVNCPLVAIP